MPWSVGSSFFLFLAVFWASMRMAVEFGDTFLCVATLASLALALTGCSGAPLTLGVKLLGVSLPSLECSVLFFRCLLSVELD